MNVLIVPMSTRGERAVLDQIQDLREQYKIDVATMNAENVAGSFQSRLRLPNRVFFLQGNRLMTSAYFW